MSNEERWVIEYPAAGKTYGPAFGDPAKYGVYAYGEWPRGSVNHGTGIERRSFKGDFDSLEEAQKEFPQAEWNDGGSEFRDVELPKTPPPWFREDNAGEVWDNSDEEIPIL